VRLSHGPILFEASTMAAKQLFTLAYGMNLLPLVLNSNWYAVAHVKAPVCAHYMHNPIWEK